MKRVHWLLLVALVASCAPKGHDSSIAFSQSVSSDSVKRISKVLAEHAEEWMAIPGVTGTGETQKAGSPAVLILVDSLTERLRSRLPDSVEGYLVVIHETGTIHALPAR